MTQLAGGGGGDSGFRGGGGSDVAGLGFCAPHGSGAATGGCGHGRDGNVVGLQRGVIHCNVYGEGTSGDELLVSLRA